MSLSMKLIDNFPRLLHPRDAPDDDRMDQTNPTTSVDKVEGGQTTAALSSILADGRMAELLYDPVGGTTAFALWDGMKLDIASSVQIGANERLIPYSANNSLIRNGIVLFPSRVGQCGSTAELVAEVRQHLHRYVDLSESFERLAAYYVLFTWVHDRFTSCHTYACAVTTAPARRVSSSP